MKTSKDIIQVDESNQQQNYRL